MLFIESSNYSSIKLCKERLTKFSFACASLKLGDNLKNIRLLTKERNNGIPLCISEETLSGTIVMGTLPLADISS